MSTQCYFVHYVHEKRKLLSTASIVSIISTGVAPALHPIIGKATHNISTSAINLSNLSIKQWPELGVHTKNRKHATTYLLNIPDLLKVVIEWDQFIRSKIPDYYYWFSPLSPETGSFDINIKECGKYRDTRARKDLREWLGRTKLPYHSPRKFRHGNAVYSIRESQDITDLKAISQNLMHSNLSITDGTYGIFSSTDVGEKIKNLGGKINSGHESQTELIDGLIRKLNQLKLDIV